MFTRSIWVALVASAGCVASSATDSVTATNDGVQREIPAAHTFTALTNASGIEAGVALVLTDGRVITMDANAYTWWALTPDSTGSYLNGTWAELARPTGYDPRFFATAILPDGRLFAGGGEYLDLESTWTTMSAIYQPTTNTWTPVTAPSGWSTIGDAQSIVLPDGRFMLANCCTVQDAILDPTNLTWTATGTGKEDSSNDEEGWTLLPDGRVLTVDSENSAKPQESETFSPATGTWSSAGTVGVQLADNVGSNPSYELGPDVMRPDGTVLAIGALGQNAVFDTSTSTWSPAPSFPTVAAGQLDTADGPAALMPNGNVLVATSPGLFQSGAVFFEWDGTQFNMETGPAGAAGFSSYEYYMVTLPTGEIMLTSQTSDIEIYEPAAATDTTAIQPVITSVPVLETTSGFTEAELATIRQKEAASANADPYLLPLMDIYTGRTYIVTGARLNGISQSGAYGDDAQTATDFPLVRFTNQASGHVQYARTHDGSNYSIAKTATGSTHLDIPTTIEGGLAKMEVVANGIASPGLLVNVK